jgi:hypothetical protein
MDGKKEVGRTIDGTAGQTDREVVLRSTIDLIKTKMPLTYARIKERAMDEKTKTNSLVRRAILGEKNCFWACENGYVVGEIFDIEDVAMHIAMFMVQFTGQHVCIFPSFVGD